MEPQTIQHANLPSFPSNALPPSIQPESVDSSTAHSILPSRHVRQAAQTNEASISPPPGQTPRQSAPVLRAVPNVVRSPPSQDWNSSPIYETSPSQVTMPFLQQNPNQSPPPPSLPAQMHKSTRPEPQKNHPAPQPNNRSVEERVALGTLSNSLSAGASSPSEQDQRSKVSLNTPSSVIQSSSLFVVQEPGGHRGQSSSSKRGGSYRKQIGAVMDTPPVMCSMAFA